MTLHPAEGLRVALLAHTIEDAAATSLAAAAALHDIGHDAVVLSSHRYPTRETTQNGFRLVRIARLPEAPLRWRGFTGPLTHAPLTLRALARGGYDIVHAFSPEDAAIALLSRRRTGTPVVFTAADPLDRDRLADRRLRLRLVQAAVEESDGVTAPTGHLAALVERWLAVDTAVLDPHDGAAHVDLYRRLLATRTR